MPNQTAPLDVARVRAALAGTRFADIRYTPRTASTNNDAQAVLGDRDALGATIVAEYQTAGAGRKGRRWFAPAGSALLFTTILPAPIGASGLWVIPFWIALAVADAVETACALALDLVWPNDLYIQGGKAGGILSVARISGDDAWVGCGVGLNVFRPAGDSDLDALDPRPQFIADSGAPIDRETLLSTILRVFDASFEELGSTAAVIARWERRARLAGTIYRYRSDADGVERDGVAQRIGAHGALVVRDADGDRAIDMADVRIVGRAPA